MSGSTCRRVSRRPRKSAAALGPELAELVARPERAGASRQPWAATDDAASWPRAPAELGHWENWGGPRSRAYDGMVWYRAHVKLSAAQAKQAATLVVGQIEDVDIRVVNGRAMGSGFG